MHLSKHVPDHEANTTENSVEDQTNDIKEYKNNLQLKGGIINLLLQTSSIRKVVANETIKE